MRWKERRCCITHNQILPFYIASNISEMKQIVKATTKSTNKSTTRLSQLYFPMKSTFLVIINQ